MKITAINNYQPSKNSIYGKSGNKYQLRNNSEQQVDTVELSQPNFKGKKGAIIGGTLGALAGIGFIVATGGFGIMGLGISAFTAACPALFGTAAGHEIEKGFS